MQKSFIRASLTKAANGGYSVLASTSSVDRQGDSIDQQGWDIKNFMANPVMLWAHDYSALPVAKATNITIDQRGLVCDYEFAPVEGNPMAQQVKTLVDEGFLNAVSVGFMPLERNGNVITKMELFEISFVPVPANPQALQLMLGKGITRDVLTKFFEVKEAEIAAAEVAAKETADKGAVADELDAQEAAEVKWGNWDELCEILGALWDVYFDEATTPDAFGTLLTEAIGLMQELAANGSDDDDSEDAQAQTASLKEKIAAKMAEIKAATGERKGLAKISTLSKNIVIKEEVATLETEGGEKIEPAVSEETGTEVSSDEEVRALLITRGLLRSDNTKTHSSLTAVNELLSARGAK